MRIFSMLACLGLFACGSAARSPKVDGSPALELDAAPLIEPEPGLVPDSAVFDLPADPLCPVVPATRPSATPLWDSISDFGRQQSWYATDQASYVAENVLYYQNAEGGWPKNIDMSYRFEVDALGAAKDRKSMFDNTATTTQIRFLAFMLGSWPYCQRYRDAFDNGLKFVFDAQYPSNGGWPQVFPIEPGDYSRHITYNDSAMTRILLLLKDIAYKNPLYGFVPAVTVEQATLALNKGINCVLQTQIVADGKKTGWCAQHDAITLLPAAARAYELPSQSGSEGPGVLSFLMTLDLSRPDMPKQDIINAVEAAVLFYDQVKIMGLRFVQSTNDAGAKDSWVVADANAGPIWARFYEFMPPFSPFFVGRDGIKVATLAEVELERRSGYSYYVTSPKSILSTGYTSWAQKWTPGRNLLTIKAVDGGTGLSP
jgi:pectinesterase